jgi:hypothetical protein
MPPLTPFSARSWEQHQVPTISALLHSFTLCGSNQELGGASIGVPVDSRIFRGRLKRSKFNDLKSYLYHWKDLGT